MFKEPRETIALFGGSFDPPHLGHKEVVLEALNVLKINTLIVVPTFLNPFKKGSCFTAKQRLQMTKELFDDIGRVEVSDFEIKESKPTPTAKSLRYFQQHYNVKYIIIGADNLENIDKWHEFKWLNSQITWVIATRKNYEIKSHMLRDFKILDVEVDMSSTQIREKILKGKCIDEH